MNSRAASAASSRRARQELVRLLFGKELSSASSKEVCRSRKLDHSRYTYTELRRAYLEKLQQLHPDKKYSEKYSGCITYSTRHSEFVELQEAWGSYDKMAKIAKTVDSEGVDKDRSFTLFGVGCSFSDTDAERNLRAEITDQACRGWLSAGSIAATSKEESQEISSAATQTPLLDEDDDMFVTVDVAAEKDKGDNEKGQTRRPSLVDQKFRPRSSAG